MEYPKPRNSFWKRPRRLPFWHRYPSLTSNTLIVGFLFIFFSRPVYEVFIKFKMDKKDINAKQLGVQPEEDEDTVERSIH